MCHWDVNGQSYWPSFPLSPGSGLELYASLEEVGDPLPKLLPPLRPPVISATEEVMVLDKPSGLRTEDALRAMMGMIRDGME